MKRRLVAICTIALLLVGGRSAFAVGDGTEGPQSATPAASACDRAPLSAAAIAASFAATPGPFEGQIAAVSSASLSQYPVVTGDDAAAVTALLAAFGGCIQRDGPAGAYAFLQPGISTVELIFLGVYDLQGGAPAPVASPQGSAPAGKAVDFTAKLVVQLPDGRLGAVIPSPQPGADLALLTLVQANGGWLIEHVAPVIDQGNGSNDGSSGGGP